MEINTKSEKNRMSLSRVHTSAKALQSPLFLSKIKLTAMLP